MKTITLTKKKEKQIGGMDYLSYALTAFGGLGMEMIYAFVIEPNIYGSEMGSWTVAQKMLHWAITCVTWLIFAIWINKDAKVKLSFSIFEKKLPMNTLQWMISILGILFSLFCSYTERGEWKFLREYRALGNVQIWGQYIYYMCETVLFLLIIVFAQEAIEKWIKCKYKIPYGGIICGLTWGLAHIFSKGSLAMGIEGVVLSTLMGSVYLLTNKDIKKAYLFLFIMFAF